MAVNYNKQCDWCGKQMTWNQQKYFLRGKTFCSQRCRSEYEESINKKAEAAKPKGPVAKFLTKFFIWAIIVFAVFIAYVVLFGK